MEHLKKYWYIIVAFFVFFMFYKPIFCVLILGIIIMFVAISSLSFFDYINKNGIKTNGKILSYESDEDGHKTPIIEFKTLDGKFISKKPHYYATTDLSIFKTYQNNINKSVEIIYSPKKPEMFVIKTEKNFNYGSIILMIIVSSFFLIISIGRILGIIKIEM